MPRQTYKGFLIGPPSPHPMLNGKMVNGKILPHSAQFWFWFFSSSTFICDTMQIMQGNAETTAGTDGIPHICPYWYTTTFI